MSTPTTQRERDSEAADDFQLKVKLLSALGKSLHEVGLPAHRLELMLEQTASQLGVSVEVFSLPTGLIMSIEGGPAPATVLLRIGLGVVHLERLARLTAVARGVARGALGAPEAKQYIDRVMNAPARWGKPSTVLAYVLSAAAFAVFFGGRGPEIVTSVAVGAAVGVLSITIRQFRLSPRVFELTSAAAASFIASLGSTLYGSFVEWIPVASGLIILLPGLALVDAVDELAHGQLTSGASRLAGVGSVLLAMAFGAVLGSAIPQPTQYEALMEVAAPGPKWWIGVALILVAVGSTIRFRARWSDFWAALLGSTLAIVGSRLGAENLGALVGPFVASFLLGLGANIYGLSFRQPAQMVTVPGLALLVPGSFGVRSMAALLTEDTAVGVDTAFRMFLTAMALVAGLLISNSLFREKSA